MKAVLASVVFAALVVACASKPPPPPVTTSSAALTTPSEKEAADVEPATIGCELVCEGARIDGVDHHAAAVADADRVVGAMHEDLLACYRKRLVTNPRAHASLTFDIVIEPDGTVRKIETTGGAMLGDKTIRCMTERLERGVFAPVHGGGTLRIHVPITLRTTQNL